MLFLLWSVLCCKWLLAADGLVHHQQMIRDILTDEQQGQLWRYIGLTHYSFYAMPVKLKRALDLKIQCIFDKDCLKEMKHYDKCHIYTDDIEHEDNMDKALCVDYVEKRVGFYFLLPHNIRDISKGVGFLFGRMCEGMSHASQGMALAMASEGTLHTREVGDLDVERVVYSMDNIKDLFSSPNARIRQQQIRVFKQ